MRCSKTFYPVKRFLLAFTAVLLSISQSFAWTVDNTWGANYSTTTNFTITTAGQLAKFAAMVNAGSNFGGKTVSLANDIDLASQAWTPIGTSSKPFRGIFDGQSHTISNLSINKSGSNYIGLFGYTSNTNWTNNAVQNVTLSSIVVVGYQYVGGLIGYVDGDVDVTNCSVVGGTVTSTNSSSENYIGGLVGYATSGSGGAYISYCSSGANISAAGIRAGGIIGYLKTGDLDHCYSTGNVTSTANSVGGLAGFTDGTAGITNSFATGNVSGASAVGGLVGVSTSSSSNACKECFAMGSVTGSGDYVGGFIGLGSNWGQITDSYSTGVVNGSGSYVGGFIGYSNDYSSPTMTGGCHIYSCYAAGRVIGGNQSTTGAFLGSAGYSWTDLNDCYADSQGTGQTTFANGYKNINSSSTLTTLNMYAAGLGSNFAYNTNYYPQLSVFSTSSDPKIKALSALSVVPVNFSSTDESDNVNYVFTTPLSSSPSVNSNLSWARVVNSGETGNAKLVQGATVERFISYSVGEYSFTATDANGYVKMFKVKIVNSAFKRFFVKSGGSDTNGGTTFASAYQTLQKAISQCLSPYLAYEIWVASGTYAPSVTLTGGTSPAASLCFELKGGVSVYGGFSGSETIASEDAVDGILQSRALKTNTTILSKSGVSSIINYDTSDGNWDYSLYDGFTISGSGVSGSSVVNIPAGATIQNCKILANGGNGVSLANGAKGYNLLVADNAGVGVTLGGASASLVNATIVNNTGVAINSSASAATVTNSVLWNNGGGNITGTTPTVTYSAASSNYIAGYASNIWNANSATTHNIELYQRSPNFKDATNTTVSSRNYELLLNSPCLGVGNPAVNSVAVDVNGLSRIYSGVIDLGAFQKPVGEGYVINGTTISQFRNPSATPAQSNLANSEVMMNPGSSLNLTADLTVSTLIINDNNVQAAPIVSGNKLTATKAYYSRPFDRIRTDDNSQAWNAFAVPFAVNLSAVDGGVENNTILIGQYNETTRATAGANRSAWEYLGTTSSLAPMKGYVLQLNSSVPETTSKLSTTMIFPSSGIVTFLSSSTVENFANSLTASTATSWIEQGWNYIGNPTGQTVKFRNASTYWPYGLSGTGATGDAGGVYFYRPNGDYYDVIPVAVVNASGIAPFTPFFIKTTTTLKNVSFTKSGSGSSPLKSSRMNLSSAAPSAVAAESDSLSIFNLRAVNSSNQVGNTYVLFMPQAHSGIVEIEDSPNMSSMTNGSNIVINTYAVGDTTALGINTLPFSGSSVKIPVAISIPKADTYTLTLPLKDDTKVVYLEDDAGQLHDLTLGYTFSAAANKLVRGNLIFVSKNPAQLSDGAKSNIRLVQISNTGIVTGTDAVRKIVIYSETGTLIKTISNPSEYAPFLLPSQSGLYLVRITTDTETTTKKVIVK